MTTNPFATDTPRLYDQQGNYRGKLSRTPYAPDSTSNPYGRHCNPFSPDSINNPFGAGNPARATLAAREQGKHQASHEAMLASDKELTHEEVFAIARRVGLDINKLEWDLQTPEWQATIDRNRTLVKLLGISGTPGFVVGEEAYSGTLEPAGLKALVAKARNKR